MRELVRTNDIVLVSAVGALLDGANIHHLVLDQNMSVIEGSLGILPQRILVHDDDNRAADRAREPIVVVGDGPERTGVDLAAGGARRIARSQSRKESCGDT